MQTTWGNESTAVTAQQHVTAVTQHATKAFSMAHTNWKNETYIDFPNRWAYSTISSEWYSCRSLFNFHPGHHWKTSA